MQGYREMLNYQALSVLIKPPCLPDYKLMIGSAERLDSLPLVIYKNYMPAQAKPLVRATSDMPAEQLDPDFVGKTYEPDDFIQDTFFIGDALGGF